MTSSSSSESDGEQERLQEAVSGIPFKSRGEPSKKKRCHGPKIIVVMPVCHYSSILVAVAGLRSVYKTTVYWRRMTLIWCPVTCRAS